MTLAELLAKLETLEDGAVMVEAIKAQTSRLNAEAKKYREAKEAADATVKTLMTQDRGYTFYSMPCTQMNLISLLQQVSS